jgi:hypothetical protein
MASLRISLVSSLSCNKYDDRLKDIFNGLLNFLKNNSSKFDFTEIECFKFSYNDEPYILSKNCIASLTPSKYIICKEDPENEITAILAIKKVHQKIPYFPAFFIANKDSEITSINSDKIKRIYLVSEGSTSGYIAPLNKLWEQKIINSPNEKSIKEINWKLIKVGNQKDVEAEIRRDKEAIGATGQFFHQDDPDECMVKPILRYYLLPQDVIIISNNLLPYKDLIISWFENLFRTDNKGKSFNKEGLVVSKSSTKITGVYRIDTEFENALNDLKIMINRIKENSNTLIIDSNSEQNKVREETSKIDFSKKKTILFLEANPANGDHQLRLGEEFREIQNILESSRMGDKFSLIPRMSVRPQDITKALLDTSAHIVHFSGHGTGFGELCFENESGKIQLVEPEALAYLFNLVSNQVDCVLLNACYTEILAKAISKHIKYVIGMDKEINDKAAIIFTRGFYQALVRDRSIEEAYKYGCVQIKLENIPNHLKPILHIKKRG